MNIKIKLTDKIKTDNKIDLAPVYRESDINHLGQTSEIAEALKELNRSEIEPDSRRSELDKRSRLNRWEINGMIVIDVLVGFEVLSMRCLTPSMSRMSKNISLAGLGRTEIVQMFQGDREHQKEAGIGGQVRRGVSGILGGGTK